VPGLSDRIFANGCCPGQRRPDVSDAGKLLGWEQIVQLQDGLLKTIEYFEREGWRQRRLAAGAVCRGAKCVT